MEKILVVVGVQPEKVAECGRKGKKIVDWVINHQDNYDATLAIVRKALGNANFERSGDKIANNNISILGYPADNIIEVAGYDLDVNAFRKDAEYHIIGISTAASVLCIAMSMYSAGLKVSVLEDCCLDRKSDSLHKYAIKIMEAYMPGCVK